MLIVTVVCTGILPNNCIVLHQYLYQYSTNKWINICIKLTLAHWTNIIVSFIYESHPISASPDIWINIYIIIHPTTASPNICIDIQINIHPTTAPICIDIFINNHQMPPSPNICIDIPQYSPNNFINLNKYLHKYSPDNSITQYLHQYSTIFTPKLHQSYSSFESIFTW